MMTDVNEQTDTGGGPINDPPDVTDIVIVAKPPSDHNGDETAGCSQAENDEILQGLRDAYGSATLPNYRIQLVVNLQQVLKSPFSNYVFVLNDIRAQNQSPQPVNSGPVDGTHLFVLQNGGHVFRVKDFEVLGTLSSSDSYELNYSLQDLGTPVQSVNNRIAPAVSNS